MKVFSETMKQTFCNIPMRPTPETAKIPRTTTKSKGKYKRRNDSTQVPFHNLSTTGSTPETLRNVALYRIPPPRGSPMRRTILLHSSRSNSRRPHSRLSTRALLLGINHSVHLHWLVRNFRPSTVMESFDYNPRSPRLNPSTR